MIIDVTSRQEARRLDWSNLPDELCLKIFSFLSWQDLENVAKVCELWRRVSQDVTLWPSYFRLLTGILHNSDPTLHMHMPNLKQFCIFSNHIAYLSPKGCSLMPLDLGDEKDVELPFPVKRLRWHPNGLLADGNEKVALINPANAEVMKEFDGEKILFFNKEIMIEADEASWEISTFSGEIILSIPKKEGDFVEAACCKNTLAFILQKQDCQILHVYDLANREMLWEKQAERFSNLAVTDHENVLFEISKKFCGVYSLKREMVFMYHATLGGDWASQSTDDYFLCFTNDNKIRVCSFDNGAIIHVFEPQIEIISAAMWENRLILYTADHILSIWDVKSGKLLFSLLINVQSTKEEFKRLPNISHNILALKREGAIVLIDLLEAKIVRELESHEEQSDLFMNDGTLHEIRLESNSLAIRSRKFF